MVLAQIVLLPEYLPHPLQSCETFLSLVCSLMLPEGLYWLELQLHFVYLSYLLYLIRLTHTHTHTHTNECLLVTVPAIQIP